MTERDTPGAPRGDDGSDLLAGGAPLHFNSPVVERLFERERARILAAAERRSFAPGEVLYALGEPPQGIFVILSGEVAVSRRTPGRTFLPIEMLRRGDILAAQVLEGAPEDGDRLPVEARAVTPTSALLLPWGRFDRLKQEIPELAKAVAQYTEIRASKRRFLAALRRAMPFRSTSPKRLGALFDAAELVQVAPGTRLVAQGAPPSGLYFVLDGELSSTQRHELPMPGSLVHELYADDLFGDLAMATGAEPATVVAVRPTRLLRVPVASYEQLLRTSASFRRSVGHVGAAGPAPVQPGEAPTSEPGNTIEVLLLQSDIPEAPLAILTDLLARTLASDHGDDVAVLELVEPAPGDAGAPLPRPTPDPELPRLARLRVPVPDGPRAAEAVEDALLSLGGVYEQVFLDASSRAPAFAAHLAPVLSDRAGRRVDGRALIRGKVVYLSRDPLAQRLPAPLAGVNVSSAVLLDRGHSPRPEGVARASRPGDVVSRERIYPAGTARLRLDLDLISTLRRPEDRRLAALPAAMRATLARWGRSITDRTVGIALGGGGAWGFAHLTLIRAMHEAGVPIDMVSGASFGSLAGAFYCGAGLAGLEQLIRLSEKANQATTASFISSTALARFVDRHLGAQRLEELEIPLFPVATDLASGSEYVVSVGTLGAGVRASGAFPGMFTPVTGGGAYCVDGAFINNVPASVLATEGADLIVASNIVAAPPAIIPSEPLLGGRIGRLLHEFNPFARPFDLIRAGFVMMHTTGQRESEFADVVFESDPVELAPHERRSLRDRLFQGKIPFWDFTVAPHVAAKAEPKVRDTVEQIKARWEQLSQGPEGARAAARGA